MVCEIEKKFVLFGTVSMRITPCGDSSSPASFGGVSSFVPFLCDVMEEDQKPNVCNFL